MTNNPSSSKSTASHQRLLTLVPALGTFGMDRDKCDDNDEDDEAVEVENNTSNNNTSSPVYPTSFSNTSIDTGSSDTGTTSSATGRVASSGTVATMEKDVSTDAHVEDTP